MREEERKRGERSRKEDEEGWKEKGSTMMIEEEWRVEKEVEGKDTR